MLQHHSDVGGLNLQIPLYSLLALFLKPTWHSALHAEQQEIKLRSALVCWADLLPHCYLIIQEPWNVLLYGRMQPQCLCLPLTTAASQSFPLCMRGFERVCAYCQSYWCYLYTQHSRQIIPPRFHTQGFELWSEKDLKGKIPNITKHRCHSSSLMHWWGLVCSKLQCHTPTCQDKSSILQHEHATTCNYTPLRPSYLSPICVTRISTARSSTLRWLPSPICFPECEKQTTLSTHSK